jgi:hypothetical protein
VSGKRKRKVGLVRIICTDPYHRDTAEFARRGFHFVCAMELFPVQTNVRGESRPFSLNMNGVSSAAIAPVKQALRVYGEHVYKFECSCGRDVQRAEFKLVDLVVPMLAAAAAVDHLATRVDLDITTL